MTRARKKKLREETENNSNDKKNNEGLRRSSRKRKVRYVLLNNNESFNEDDFYLDDGEEEDKKTKDEIESLEEPFASCYQLLQELMEHEDAPAFNEPVDVEGLELVGYREIVINPMDLGTIKTKLLKRKYKTVEEFIADVKLVFDNCILYNESASEIGVAAQVLWSFFKKSSHRYKIKVPDDLKSLNSVGVSKNLLEELKLKPDIEIHTFCKKRNLTQFLLTKGLIFFFFFL